MAVWPEIPEWQDPTDINKGNLYEAQDGLTFADLNKMLQNLLYLKEFGGGVTPITLEVFKNGTYNAGNDGLEVFEKVTVNVPQTIIDAILIPKTVNKNGTYNASDDSADGYSSFTVNIPSAEGVSF